MRIIFLAIALVMWASGALAEPSAEIEALMMEPASLLDLGLEKMNQQFTNHSDWFNEAFQRNFPVDNGAFYIDVEFSFEDNLIMVNYGFYGNVEELLPNHEKRKEFVEYCLEHVDAGFTPPGNEISRENKIGIVRGFFSHSGYTDKGMKELDWDKFAERFLIVIDIRHEEYARRKYLGGRVMYSE